MKKFELMYITNEIEKAKLAEEVGVDIIFIDTEINGKIARQGNLDTVISKHSLKDVLKLRPHITKSKILTRINPIYQNSLDEINTAIEYGTDIIMLPMFKTKEEVQKFITMINGRVETCLLLETSNALVRIDDILDVPGIDRIHIGLNDLHLSLHLDFMFECLSGGIVEYLINKIKSKNIKYGFGGIAKLGDGDLKADLILSEHVRLGSKMVILSRTFKKENTNLKYETHKIRKKYNLLLEENLDQLKINQLELKKQVDEIVNKIIKNKEE